MSSPLEPPWAQAALFPTPHIPALRRQVAFSLLQPLPHTTILLSWIQLFRASSEGPAFQLCHSEPSPSSCPDLLPPFTVSWFPEDFGIWYCLPPSSHPAITLSYCREQEQPVRTLDSRPPLSPLHLRASPANRTTWTATKRLRGSVYEMQTLLDDSHLSAQISLSPQPRGPLRPPSSPLEHVSLSVPCCLPHPGSHPLL